MRGIVDVIFQNVNPERGRKLIPVDRIIVTPLVEFQNVNPERGRKHDL